MLTSNGTYVEVVAAASSTVSGDVVLTSETGSRVVLADGTAKNQLPGGVWSYVTPGVISTASPGENQVDTVVTISGAGLLGGGVSAAFVSLANGSVKSTVSSSPTSAVVVAPADGDDCK